MGSIIDVPNETESSCSRITKEGRKITYKLRVIQQPARARACGSGAKSSADRRPVDPPPIVELLIFEGENADNDITVSMNANYFLFATLEPARHIAAGRVQQEQQKLTVLTGTPVAGLVYLDRPSPAGYFLFPDLSVRHEGHYRLGFNLYEELKEEKDEDRIDDESKANLVGPTHVSHRLEVKSAPFIVFSAKKFPGLNRSTELSRLVAEQGCRVRIRRDIRIKKRGKDGKEIEYDDEDGDAYNQETELDHQPHRPRSASVESQRSLAPRAQPHDTPHAQHRPHASVPLHGGLKIYGYDPSHHPVYQQHQPVYGGPNPTGSMAPPRSATYASHHPAPAQHGVHHGPMLPRTHDSSPTLPPYSNSASRGAPLTPQSVTTAASPTSNPYEGNRDISPAASMSHRMLPVLNTGPQIPARLLEPSSPSTAGPSPSYSESSRSLRGDFGQPSGGKRSYGEAFDAHHMSGPMRRGARPVAGMAPSHSQMLAVDPDEGDDLLASLKMRYRRADGRQISKLLS